MSEVASEIGIKNKRQMKRHWMTTEILEKMEEQRQCKEDVSEESQRKYKELKHEIQRLCRQAKTAVLNEKCREIEVLEATHNPAAYHKIKELTRKEHHTQQGLKSKDGTVLFSECDILERWAEYVEELYYDTGEESMNMETQEKCTIDEEEIKAIVRKLTRKKATGQDNIPAEFIQNLGENGIQLITRLMNRIYNSGNIPCLLYTSPSPRD